MWISEDNSQPSLSTVWLLKIKVRGQAWPQVPVPAEQSCLPYNLWFFNDTQITERKPRPQPLLYYHEQNDLELSGSPRLLVLCVIILCLRGLVIFSRVLVLYLGNLYSLIIALLDKVNSMNIEVSVRMGQHLPSLLGGTYLSCLECTLPSLLRLQSPLPLLPRLDSHLPTLDVHPTSRPRPNRPPSPSLSTLDSLLSSLPLSTPCQHLHHLCPLYG